ncbi:26S proteasome regulatory subunit N10 [Rhodotorula toruloides]|uniref:26S proteasome regulatory subunit N10 n=1 Tax=Rhodotorula toruloides TaxID=5286 RepID=A0A511KF31_RHOTO|nr:26S proteasome regulatory subunit N10 [Rhodotorula toruloides]
MLVLDNSQHSLNGDFPPTRLQAQADSVFQIMGAKCRSHPENEVGLMVMAGKGPEVLVTFTQDEGKLVAALHGVKSTGEADLVTGIQVAQLALKHRQNKNQRQRIIVFVGSPVKESQASLVKLGKKLKKNNVALDIVSFGTPDVDLSIPSASSSSSAALSPPESNDTKLSALVDATSSSDNSHFLSVEPGPYLLSEKIAQSAILRPAGADEEMGGAGGGEGAADQFGVDPNLDPELAMALRMSLEEERARQAAATAATSTSAAAALEPVPEGVSTQITDPTPATEPKGAHLTSAPATTDADVMRSSGPFRGDEDQGMQVGGVGEHAKDDEGADEGLRRAGEEGDVEMGGLPGVDDTVDGDEEDDIARAIALSMQDAEGAGDEDKQDEGQ